MNIGFILILVLSIYKMPAFCVETYALSPLSSKAYVVDTTAFIDFFPIKSYIIDDNIYIIADDLLNYGFEFESSTEDTLNLFFNIDKDFIPMEGSEIHIRKDDILNQNIVYDCCSSTQKVYLDGLLVECIAIEKGILIPFESLSQYGTFSWNDQKKQMLFTYNRDIVEVSNIESSKFSGRFVRSIEVEKFTQGNGSLYPYIAIDSYSNYYTNGVLNGYTMSMIENIMHGDIRTEAVYINGVKEGFGRECRMDDEYLYGYRLEWEGEYSNDEKVLLEQIDKQDEFCFDEIFTGSDYVIFKGNDSSYYIMGYDSNYSRWDRLVYIGDTLENNEYFHGNNIYRDIDYYLEDGKFIDCNSKNIIIDEVKEIYQSSTSRNWYDSEWSAGRTLFLKEDGSLWFSRLNHNCDMSSWGDGKDLSQPIKIMDDVIDAEYCGLSYYAIKSDSSLWWFGTNFNGEAGNGTKDIFISGELDEEAIQYIPIKIMDNVKRVVAGNEHFLVLTHDGVMYGWGNNEYGQLGQENFDEYLYPIKMMEDVKDIDASWYASYAIKNDGTAWWCGSMRYTAEKYDDFLNFKQLKNVYRYLSENFYTNE